MWNKSKNMIGFSHELQSPLKKKIDLIFYAKEDVPGETEK